MIERFKAKWEYDWERLSTTKKVVYGVFITAAVVVCTLSFTGVINLFPAA